MSIKKPGSALGKTIKLKNVKLATGHGKKSPNSDLNLTPMVDTLTVLVVFLLMSFSASGEILFATKDIVLPPAFHTSELERAPVVAVSKATIGFEGQFVMNAADVTEAAYPDWKLTPLYTYLTTPTPPEPVVVQGTLRVPATWGKGTAVQGVSATSGGTIA